MANHLIIGLGGTGGKILREFRKRYFEQFNGFEPHNGVHIEYLYVDTSASDIKMNDWEVMGTSVQLADHQVLSNHENPSGMLDDISSHPKINSFISSRDIDILRSESPDLISSGIASQRRRLGRLLFAANADEYLKKVMGQVDRLKLQSSSNNVTFHICAGLAGGTGSGMIIDAIAQLHKLYGNRGTQPVKIHLYLFIPEQTNPNPGAEAYRYYQANGYAALLELNAWSVDPDGYAPIDITVGKNPDGILERIKVANKVPFESAYLFSDTNDSGAFLDKGTGLPQMVADFLFQKTVEADGGLAEALSKVDTAENSGFGEPEKDTETAEPNHSRRFLSFGMQRVTYPEKEIKESMACQYALSSVNRAMFNDWRGGYVVSDRPTYNESAVRRAEGSDLGRLKLDDSTLCFEQPLTSDDSTKSWNTTFAGYWSSMASKLANLVMDEEDDKDNWVPSFNQKLQHAYNEGFRRNGANGGVVRFFNSQTEPRALQNTTDKIVNGVESYLFNEWKSGRMSIYDIKEYLIKLISTLIGEGKEFSKKIGNAEAAIKELTSEKTETINKFLDRNIFGAIFKKRREYFLKYAEICGKINTFQTQKLAYEAGLKLISVIESRLSDMSTSVTKIMGGFDAVAEDLKKRVKSSELPQSGITSEGKTYFYDNDVVKEGMRTTVGNQSIQDEAAQRVRNGIVDSLGTEHMHTFRNLQQKYFNGNSADVNQELINIILKESMGEVALNLDNIAKETPAKSMTKVNIIQKLSQELGEGQHLTDFMTSLKKGSARYLQMDKTEISRTQGLSGTNEARIICLPTWAEDKDDYRTKIAERCGLSVKKTEPKEVVENNNVSEITLVSLFSAFPLRYVSNIASLKHAYQTLLSAPNADYNRLVMHTENRAAPLPDLYNISGAEKAQRYEATYILGKALGLVSEGQHPDDESPVTTYKYKNDMDMVKTDFIEVVGFNNVVNYLANESEGNKVARKLGKYVQEVLASEYTTISGKQKLRQAILNILTTDILPLCKGGEIGKEYKEHEKIVENILKNDLK